MAKVITKAVTRFQKFLAAIAGDGTAPNPITSDEKLMYNIAEKMNESGGGSGGGGGGVLVVRDVNGTLDKTWREIHDAVLTTGAVLVVNEYNQTPIGTFYDVKGGTYVVCGAATGNWNPSNYAASSTDGYPTA